MAWYPGHQVQISCSEQVFCLISFRAMISYSVPDQWQAGLHMPFSGKLQRTIYLPGIRSETAVQFTLFIYGWSGMLPDHSGVVSDRYQLHTQAVPPPEQPQQCSQDRHGCNQQPCRYHNSPFFIMVQYSHAHVSRSVQQGSSSQEANMTLYSCASITIGMYAHETHNIGLHAHMILSCTGCRSSFRPPSIRLYCEWYCHSQR